MSSSVCHCHAQGPAPLLNLQQRGQRGPSRYACSVSGMAARYACHNHENELALELTGRSTMRIESTTKVLEKCMLKYDTISWCAHPANEGPKALCKISGRVAVRSRQQRQALVKLTCPVHKAFNGRRPYRGSQVPHVMKWLDVKRPCTARNQACPNWEAMPGCLKPGRPAVSQISIPSK